MVNKLKWAASVLAVTGVVACGGGPKFEGKEEVGRTVYELGKAAGMAGNGQAMPLGSSEIECDEGGKVLVSINASGTSFGGASLDGGLSLDVARTLKYEKCSYDGKRFYDGSLDATTALDASQSGGSSSVDIDVQLKGKVDVSGDLSDYVELDLHQTISASSTQGADGGVASGSAQVTLDGTVKTSNGTHTYDNEVLAISADGGVTITKK
jgi:hypothetical protein